MPLIKSKSKKALEENIATEMHANPSPEKRAQNIAIAYSVKRRAAAKKMAMGGEMDDMPEESPASIAEHIMKKRKMAEGGEVDLQDNADEHLNEEDQLSFEAARKKTYFDDSQLSDQPEDSNEHGDELSDEDEHDMVDKILKKRRMK